METDSSPTLPAGLDVAAIEQALVAQWRNFGSAPGGSWHEEGDLAWSEAPVPELPYNAVLKTRLGSNADERIDRLFQRFRQRVVQFPWMVHPTSEPADLAERLVARGLTLAEHLTGMALDLASWQRLEAPPAGPIHYAEVVDGRGLDAFEELMAAYWELSDRSLPFVLGVSRWAHERGALGARWVAYRDARPVGKAYLSFAGPEDTAALFGVYVRPEARGHGVAGTLSRLAVDRAAALGKRRVVLHSSAMAAEVYRRLGFVGRPPFDLCHAIAAYESADMTVLAVMALAMHPRGARTFCELAPRN